MEYTNIHVYEFEFDTQADAQAAMQEGTQIYDMMETGYTDAEGRQLTKQELEYLGEIAKWIIRLIFGIPV